MYTYELINNHYIINIGGYRFLLDTGSKDSFWMHQGPSELLINNKNYLLSERPEHFDIKETEELIGTSVDGFIGMDIIHQTSLTIYKNGLMAFEALNEKGKFVQIDDYGLLAYKAQVGSTVGECIIDTGAKYGYAINNVFNGLTPYDCVNDYNPILKHLRSNIYHVDVDAGAIQATVDICYNSRVANQLRFLGAIMIANITSLFDEACVIDIKKGLMVLR